MRVQRRWWWSLNRPWVSHSSSWGCLRLFPTVTAQLYQSESNNKHKQGTVKLKHNVQFEERKSGQIILVFIQWWRWWWWLKITMGSGLANGGQNLRIHSLLIAACNYRGELWHWEVRGYRPQRLRQRKQSTNCPSWFIRLRSTAMALLQLCTQN